MGAYSAYMDKDYATCIRLFLELAERLPHRGDELIGAASCEMRVGQRTVALMHVKQAVQRGYRESLADDEDLAPLRDDKDWAGLVSAAQANAVAYDRTVNLELRALRVADQLDRQGDIDWAVVNPRDSARRARVTRIVEERGLGVAEDYFNAALVFQHSDDVDGIRQAHALALRAAELNPEEPMHKPLVAMSEDRILVREGKLQRYGTQLFEEGGVWKMNPVNPSVGDDEREALGVPTLEQAMVNLAAMNQSTVLK